jgi:hypothetical protein
MFKASDRVVVSIPQLHGKISVIESGEVISVEGNEATVMLAGEEVPRTVPLDRLQAEQETFGGMTERPNEMPVINQIRY